MELARFGPEAKAPEMMSALMRDGAVVNQYLYVPREVADRYPDRVRRLLGYQRHGSLGHLPGDPDTE